MTDRELVRRIERAWADQEIAFATALADLDPTWGTEVFPIADGIAVLCGPGLFLNRVLGVGLDGDLHARDLDELERRAGRVGVAPAIEVCEASRPSIVELLVARGYGATGRTSALAIDIGSLRVSTDHDLPVELDAVTDATLASWQAATAEGWGLTDPDARRASDAFAGAAHVADDPGLLIARSVDDGRPLGCASLRADGPIATLGGASTLPTERRRGVQRAMVEHRLRLAATAGCAVATTAAEPGSASERNLMRLGFRLTHTKTTYELPAVSGDPSTV